MISYSTFSVLPTTLLSQKDVSQLVDFADDIFDNRTFDGVQPLLREAARAYIIGWSVSDDTKVKTRRFSRLTEITGEMDDKDRDSVELVLPIIQGSYTGVDLLPVRTLLSR